MESAPPSQSEDLALLQQWVKTHSHHAFRALVDKFAPLVWSAALRMTRNASLAEEASQQVFTDLARKAPLVANQGRPLTAWLHRAARYEALQVLRKEIRQRQRLESYAVSHAHDSAPSDPWAEILPHLDHAINELGETDRTVVLLHWFQSRTYAEIARELGCEPAAAQRRGLRAMDKLAASLRKHHIAISSTALAALPCDRLFAAVPAGLGKSLSATSTTTGSATASPALFFQKSLHTMATAKLTTTAVVLLSAAFPVGQQMLSQQAAAPLASTVISAPAGPAGKSTPPASVRQPAALDLNLVQQALGRVLANPEDYRADLEFRRLLLGLSLAEIPDVLKMLLAVPKHRMDGLHELARTLFARWAELAPEAANLAALEVPRKTYGFAPIRGAFVTWAAQDLEAAWKWLHGPNQSADNQKFVGGEALDTLIDMGTPGADLMKRVDSLQSESSRADLRYWVVRAWVRQNKDLALAWTTNLPTEKERQAWQKTTLELASEKDPRWAMGHIAEVDNPDRREEVAHNILWPWLLQKPKETFPLLAKHTADWPTDLFRDAGDALTRHDSTHAMESARKLPAGPVQQAFVMGMITGTLESENIAAILPALAMVPENDLIGQLNQFSDRLLQQNPQAAAAWVRTLKPDSFLYQSHVERFPKLTGKPFTDFLHP